MKRLLAIACVLLVCNGVGAGQIRIAPNATDVSVPIAITNPATLAMYTGLTVTGFDLYYHVGGSAISAKADATAGSVTAHGDSTAVEIGMGLYEIDWPDAVWASRTPGTIIELVVEWDTTNHYTVSTQVQIEAAQTGDSYARLGAPAGASVSADVAAVNALLSHATYGLAKLYEWLTTINDRIRY